MLAEDAQAKIPSCCSPARGVGRPSAEPTAAATTGARSTPPQQRATGLVELPGGTFLMGAEDADAVIANREGPVRTVHVEAFAVGTTAVTNHEFATFVDATGYVTDAERHCWSFVFAGLLPDDLAPTRGVAAAPWWREVHGADWQHPEGPHSRFDERGDHPAVHVSHRDALAYCAWAGVRLPTEREWEYAARGGLVQARYPWGDDLLVQDQHMCNIWQGEFPTRNTQDDGWVGTAPARSFTPNGYGLFNVAGNVWEWCADPFDAPSTSDAAAGVPRVIRGGSYLCHASYCNRYRVAARSANTPDSTTGNMGFRVASSLPAPPQTHATEITT